MIAEMNRAGTIFKKFEIRFDHRVQNSDNCCLGQQNELPINLLAVFEK